MMPQGPGTWRRDPIGAAMSIYGNRRKKGTYVRPVFLGLELDQFEEQLRACGASEKMIQQELLEFKRLKQEAALPGQEVERRMAARKKRPVPHDLDEYVEAEIRREAGVVAEEILDDLRTAEELLK